MLGSKRRAGAISRFRKPYAVQRRPRCCRCSIPAHPAACLQLQDGLGAGVDVERIAARVALKSARPRDLSGLRDTLARLPQLSTQVAAFDSAKMQALAIDLQPLESV